MSQDKKEKISIIIPVLNEQDSIGKVLDDIPKEHVDQIVVINNGSTDDSKEVARQHGAIVLDEPERGYGAACLKGISYLHNNDPPDILVFLDGDYSDYPQDMFLLINEIQSGYDFVLGSRILGIQQGQAVLPVHSVHGNKLISFFLRCIFNGQYTDLGPFRAIKFKELIKLEMKDRNYGWTIEMQIKALRHQLKIKEIPIRYRKRFSGRSKVTGSLTGSIKAIIKISYIFILHFFKMKWTHFF